jgi:NADP-dependent 3-hydroxy acid dehydrogenase YdfG
VTGAGGVIGTTVAVRLAAAGYDVVLTALAGDELEQVDAKCGSEALVVPADLTRPVRWTSFSARLSSGSAAVQFCVDSSSVNGQGINVDGGAVQW